MQTNTIIKPSDRQSQPAPLPARSHTPDNQILVRLTRPCLTRETHFIIPAGTQGRVVGLHVDDTGEWDRYHWLIDFGVLPIISVPYDSPLLKVLNGGER